MEAWTTKRTNILAVVVILLLWAQSAYRHLTDQTFIQELVTSVPRLALPVTGGRFEEEFLKAAVLHDAYASDDNRERCPDQYHKRPWKDVHRMFYEACIAGGTSKTKATIMFAAVWLAGDRWDEPASMSLDQVSDEALQAEFEMCKEWIEQNDPTIQEVEAMLDDHALRLLSDQP